MKWHCVKNNYIFPFYILADSYRSYNSKILNIIKFFHSLIHKHNCVYYEFLSKLHFYWNFLKTIAILLIIAEMVITIYFSQLHAYVFFALKISKFWKLFKFPVVQSGPTAGPLVNPIPLVPEKNQGPHPFGISWICYWNTHVNTRLNMYWGKYVHVYYLSVISLKQILKYLTDD